MAEIADVFISYSREDKDKVLELATQLRAAGVSLWIDQGGIDGATLWGEEIVNALEGAKVMLLAITASAARSHNVAKEVTLFSERKGHILPVHLEPTRSRRTQVSARGHPAHRILPWRPGREPEDHPALARARRCHAGAQCHTQGRCRRRPSRALPRRGRPPRMAPRPPGAGAVAVLPFDNITTDQETDYFSDGLTEELIARLSLVSEIELVSRWASMQYKGRKQDIGAIGSELGARYIVGGSVRRFQDSVRITVQLVDVGTNRQLWGNTYKGKLDDIFDIQEQVAQQIVEALKLKLSFSEKVSLTKRQTVNAQAYDLYLRGQDYLYRLHEAQRRVRDPAV